MANIGTLTASLQLQSAAFIRDMGRARAAVASNTAQMRRSMRTVETASANVGRQVTTMTRAFRGLGAVLAVAGVGVAAREFTDMADTMTLLRSRIRLVVDSNEELATSQKRLFDISQQTRTGLEATSTLFQRVARSRNELGKSVDEILDFTRTIQQLTITSGASATEATAAVIQLSQGLASGQVRGEELRSVMEQLPAVAQAAAAGMNKTLGEFRDASLNGEVSARQFFDAIIKGSAQAEKDFASIQRTAGQAMTQLRNDLLKAVDGSNQVSGATGTLVGAIDTLRDAVKSPAFVEGLSNIASAGAAIARNLDVLTEAVGAVYRNFRELSAAFAAIIAYKLASTFLGIAAAVFKYVTAVRTAVAVTGTFNAIIKRNPIGLLATAAAIGVGALIEFSDSKEEATKASKRHADALGKETDALSTQAKALQAGQKATLEKMAALAQSRADALRELKALQDDGNLGGLDQFGPGESVTTPSGREFSGFELQSIAVKGLTAAIEEEERAVKSAQQKLVALNAEMMTTAKVTEAVASFTDKQTKAFLALQASLLPGVKAHREYTESVALIDAAFKAGQVNLMQYNLMLEALQMNLDEATNSTKKLEEAQKKASEAQTATVIANDRIRDETQAVLNGAKAWEKFKAAREINDEVSALSKDLKDAGLASEEIKRLTEQRKFLLENQSEAMKQLQQEQALYSELEAIGTRSFDRIGSAVTEMFVQGKAGAFEFKNIALSVVSELAQSFIQLAAINPLKNALFGTSSATLSGAGGILGSLFSGGSSISNGSAGGVRAPRSSGFLSSISSFFKFADGGSFTVGSGFPSVNAGRDNRMVSFAARDGERVTVETPGQQRMRSGGGTAPRGGDINIYPDLRGASAEAVDALHSMVRDLKANQSAVAIESVVKARRRNPRLFGA